LQSTEYIVNQKLAAGRKDKIHHLKRGFYAGLPIALGYIPVSFTFGLMAVNGGIPVWMAVFISLTNLTSAGQFAGLNLIIANATYFEIALTTFVINIRYMLMSLSLSQKIEINTTMLKRCILAFGITDETFAVASQEEKDIDFSFMLGLIIGPYIGWALGTLLGAATTSILPESVQASMGIALYGMFIAILIPAAKKSKEVVMIIAMAVFISSVFKWVPVMNRISEGWSIIAATVISSIIGAVIFTREEEEYE